ncbi:hypothetical protein BH24ACT20_BH24ACT20_03410 [soil metagenome]
MPFVRLPWRLDDSAFLSKRYAICTYPLFRNTEGNARSSQTQGANIIKQLLKYSINRIIFLFDVKSLLKSLTFHG